MFTHTDIKETDYTLTEIKQYTTELINSKTGRPRQGKLRHYNKCMGLLCDYIRVNRWELLNSFTGYKVITNGHREFKGVTIGGANFTAAQIFFKIEQLTKG